MGIFEHWLIWVAALVDLKAKLAAWWNRRLVARLVCRLKNHPKAGVMAQDYELFRQCPRCGKLPGIRVEGRVLAVRHLPGDPNGPRVAVGVPGLRPDISSEGTRRLLMAVYNQEDLDPEPRRPIFTELDRVHMFFNRFGK